MAPVLIRPNAKFRGSFGVGRVAQIIGEANAQNGRRQSCPVTNGNDLERIVSVYLKQRKAKCYVLKNIAAYEKLAITTMPMLWKKVVPKKYRKLINTAASQLRVFTALKQSYV